MTCRRNDATPGGTGHDVYCVYPGGKGWDLARSNATRRMRILTSLQTCPVARIHSHISAAQLLLSKIRYDAGDAWSRLSSVVRSVILKSSWSNNSYGSSSRDIGTGCHVIGEGGAIARYATVRIRGVHAILTRLVMDSGQLTSPNKV